MTARNAILNLGATEVVSFSAAAASNTASPTLSRTVLVTTDTDCFVNATVAATVTNGAFLPAKVPQLIALPAGATLSFIGTGAGKAYVTDVRISS